MEWSGLIPLLVCTRKGAGENRVVPRNNGTVLRSTIDRSVVAETFRMRGFSVRRFPKWETKPMPKEARDELLKELINSGLLPEP